VELYEHVIKQAICEYPDYDTLIKGLLKVGRNVEDILIECKITTGVPVKPMLAQPTKGINIVFKRFENMKFTCEYKYDGLRGQIHYNNGKCTIFSRNLENMTEQYPDIVEFVLESTKPEVNSFIIDSEIVAINPVNQKILPFQKLATRGRKNVDKNTIEISVCLYLFDILYFNGEPLIKNTLKKRREYIAENFKEVTRSIDM
jgi:DNA ligase 1